MENDYDPVGGHTKEEAEAAYAGLFEELHGVQEVRRERVAVVYSGDSDVDGKAAAVAYARLKNEIDTAREYVPCAVDEGARVISFSGCHPYGADCTFVYEVYIDKGVVPDARTAEELCKGIVSGTDSFRSETTTREDRIACAALANIAGIDLTQI